MSDKRRGQQCTVSGTGHLALDLAQIQHDLHSLCISSLYAEVLLTQQGAPLQSVLSWLGLWFRHTDNYLSGKEQKQVLQFSFEHLNSWEQSSILPQDSSFQYLEADFSPRQTAVRRWTCQKTFVQGLSWLDKR